MVQILLSVKVDPLSETNLDLTHPLHHHLVPYIKELCVVCRSDSSPLPNYNQDVTEPFTKFLHSAQNVSSMVYGDSRIQWDNVSSKGIGAFCAVFQRSWFRSLEVSVDKPLPYWILLHGLSVGSELTVRCIGRIMRPLESGRLNSYQCSLTCLVLIGKSSIKKMTKFCRKWRDLARILLRKVVKLVLKYDETYPSRVPPISPYPEVMVALLASKLECLDISLGSCDIQLSHIIHSALRNLKALQRFNISVIGRPTYSHDTLLSANAYMKSVLFGLPPSSLLRSLSLSVDDRKESVPGTISWKSKYQNLLQCIYDELTGTKKWPRLTAIHILINMVDNNVAEPIHQRDKRKIPGTDLSIISLLYVNSSKEGGFGSSVTPQMG